MITRYKTQPSAKILVVDDQPHDGELAALVLRTELKSADVRLATDAVAFSEALVEGGFDLVISERRLKWGNAVNVVEVVNRLHPRCQIAFFTEMDDPGSAFEAAKLGAEAYIVKGSAGYLQLPLMVRALQERLAERSRPEPGSDALLERFPMGLFRLAQSGALSCLNPACRSLFRLSGRGDPEDVSVFDLFPDDSTRARFASLLQSGTPLTDYDARLPCPGEQPVWVRISVWSREGRRESDGFEGVAFDITGYKQVVSNMTLDAEELSRSNTELEKFAYVASHDLQEPLSYISRYARLFNERYHSQLDDDGVRYLGHILDSSRRLQSMVDDILTYARIGTQGSSFEPVDFGVAADTTALSLDRAFNDANADFERGALPTLDADGRQIQQLFQNLFSNALKFKGQNPPRIRVAAEEIDEGWQFSVADNGIGIDLATAERIFGMFQRLHTNDEYPGTGIGLAICRSIVDRHGGKIWVESAPGQGATFYFTIKKKSSPPVDLDGEEGQP